MQFLRRLAVVLVVCSGLVAAGWAQFGRMGKGMGQSPSIPGLFKPEVGSGAQYEITNKGQKMMSWSFAIVGKESVEGSEGYWLEMRGESGEASGMIMKTLAVVKDGQTDIKRMIMQQAGQPPMEMPMGMMGMMPRPQQAAKEEALGEKVGTETVTVPAGTFTCDHYKSKHGNEPADIWISAKVSPYGLIKMTSASSNMVLLKVLSNETSKIKGEPQKMDFGMPGGRPQ